MSATLVLISLIATGLLAMFAPWLGIAAAYFIAILNPNAIWWWNFSDIRPIFIIVLTTLIGLAIHGIRNQLRWSAIANIRGFCLLVLWLSGMLSWWLSPYAQSFSTDGNLDLRGADFIMSNLSKIILVAIFATACIQNAKHLKAMEIVILTCGIYMAWWVNKKYFFEGAWGRIGGPTDPNGIGAYADENVLGALLVATFPFVWFGIIQARNILMKLMLMLALPLIWHALFLTGSRGAFLALCATMAVIYLRSKNKISSSILISLFLLAFFWQAGELMKERVISINSPTDDPSASSRIEAWEIGIKMMLAYPITGVGPGAFIRAYGEFSDGKQLQAHNTFVQFGAEFGVLSLLAITTLFLSCIISLWKIPQTTVTGTAPEVRAEISTREATLASIVGVMSCAVFLSLQLFEVMYFLFFLSCVFIENQKSKQMNGNKLLISSRLNF